MQTLHAGCSKVEPIIFAPPPTPFPWVWDGQNLISWRWSLPLSTNPVWWGSMHAISSYCGNRPTHTQTQTVTITIPCTAASAQCNDRLKEQLGDRGSHGKWCINVSVCNWILQRNYKTDHSDKTLTVASLQEIHLTTSCDALPSRLIIARQTLQVTEATPDAPVGIYGRGISPAP